ncbi:class I SAM-dependent methyltransferase [Rubrobacter marinus]|uniref:class I SAM-dependent methyltransferase n=1 Tax=Rubrobacter marinus TaxID=2653852 RepID=UPI0014084C56|nr:class I SAM-dependent methyltransferase [Rubrobacter marinus]
MTPAERDEYEEDLIAVSDRELDLIGDVRGLDVLYAGGASPLWLEGLSLRVGRRGTVTALDHDREKVEGARELLEDADLEAPVHLYAGDVFEPPFAPSSFDLVYSAGLFHELDVSEGTAGEALAALAGLVRPGGRLATSDFVDTLPAVQLEDEDLDRALARALSGSELYGIGPPERLVALHESLLEGVAWTVSPPRHIRHLDGLVLAGDEPDGLRRLPATTAEGLRRRRAALLERVRREGYTRPATLYLTGTPADRRPR